MSIPSPNTESSLLHLLAHGNVGAFRELYHCYSASVYDVARRLLRDEARAQDMVQEVFTTIWQKRRDFTRVDNFRSYLVVMTRNLALKHLRQLAREAEVNQEWLAEHPQEGDSTTQQLGQQELENLLQEAVSLLPPQQNQVYHLSKIEGLDYKAIGEHLNISPNTAKVHLVQANNFIRQRLVGYK